MAHSSTLRSRNPAPWPSLFNELRRDMDSVFHRYAGDGALPQGRGVFPPVNLYESGDAYELTAELPGLEAGDVHVTLHGATVTLEGERKLEVAHKEGSAHRQERPSGSFRRAFELPVAIDGDQVTATHKNGVLRLHLPKAAEHRPRQITVGSE